MTALPMTEEQIEHLKKDPELRKKAYQILKSGNMDSLNDEASHIVGVPSFSYKEVLDLWKAELENCATDKEFLISLGVENHLNPNFSLLGLDSRKLPAPYNRQDSIRAPQKDLDEIWKDEGNALKSDGFVKAEELVFDINRGLEGLSAEELERLKKDKIMWHGVKTPTLRASDAIVKTGASAVKTSASATKVGNSASKIESPGHYDTTGELVDSAGNSLGDDAGNASQGTAAPTSSGRVEVLGPDGSTRYYDPQTGHVFDSSGNDLGESAAPKQTKLQGSGKLTESVVLGSMSKEVLSQLYQKEHLDKLGKLKAGESVQIAQDVIVRTAGDAYVVMSENGQLVQTTDGKFGWFDYGKVGNAPSEFTVPADKVRTTGSLNQSGSFGDELSNALRQTTNFLGRPFSFLYHATVDGVSSVYQATTEGVIKLTDAIKDVGTTSKKNEKPKTQEEFQQQKQTEPEKNSVPIKDFLQSAQNTPKTQRVTNESKTKRSVSRTNVARSYRGGGELGG